VGDRDRTTLTVAVVGIAATALVGLAGTAASWLSARNDRETQQRLARDQRTYDRRVSVYLDTIDFVEGQRLAYAAFGGETVVLPVGDLPKRVPIHYVPSTRLTTRLRAFGSTEIFRAFQKAERLNRQIPFDILVVGPALGSGEGATGGSATAQWLSEGSVFSPKSKQWISERTKVTQKYVDTDQAFRAQTERFENLVHEEIG
jgi:hypothetical protein